MLTHDDMVGDIYAERIVDALDIHGDNGYSEVDSMVTEYENAIRAAERRKVYDELFGLVDWRIEDNAPRREVTIKLNYAQMLGPEQVIALMIAQLEEERQENKL